MCMYILYRSIIYFRKQAFTMPISSSSSPYSILFFSISLLLLSSPCLSADPDPLQDFCVGASNSTLSINGFPCKPVSQVSSADFFFDGFIKAGNTSNIFGVGVTSANVLTFPGLNTLGISINRLDIAPGGMNPPHSHPRSTESGVVIEGQLLVGFVSTSNVFYSKVLGPGEMFVIPRGLVHFQKNVGQEKALLFVAFNSHLPGTVVVPTTFFATQPAIPNDVLTQTFQIGEDVVNDIRSKFV